MNSAAIQSGRTTVKKDLIEPRTLKGFRDYLPSAMIPREQLIETAKSVYRSYGFSPIDTPALEYTEILTGKGGTESDKQMFRFEQGGRDVAMRFDLTVPFARFAAQNIGELGTPFKRYHVGTVWRGERPQKGRYREFVQCDFDTIGTTSNSADIETLFIIHDLMVKIGFSDFTIHINNRKILNGLLESLDLQSRSAEVLRALDKLPKIGADAVIKEMQEQGDLTQQQAEKVISLTTVEGSTAEILNSLEKQLVGNECGEQGVAYLREVFDAVDKAGIVSERIVLDPSIARGLDYYTGTIYETFLNQLPGIGSVCSGGRYDNLAELFTTQQLPGVGASLGLDRLLAAMQELNLLDEISTPAPILVTQMDAKYTPDYLRIARDLRMYGFNVEVYPDTKAIKKQFKYANRHGFKIVIVAGDDEFEKQEWQVKDMQTGTQTAVRKEELLEHIRRILA
ncbi:histidine--tRNA ligase [Gimesia maris]|uniref:Histidine--tRNA ligase n=1 Tax=Gimesia maris TaxID=122 RepID=A0ABX5YLT2_9PLAN|nr:Histidine--tRNA ligase [Gimesia maris]QEG16641.1 Histidine--tRNA ligase [Gimesia maris]QGQ30193.1 histidine--tRNA ligase [Gimesia maris]